MHLFGVRKVFNIYLGFKIKTNALKQSNVFFFVLLGGPYCSLFSNFLISTRLRIFFLFLKLNPAKASGRGEKDSFLILRSVFFKNPRLRVPRLLVSGVEIRDKFRV